MNYRMQLSPITSARPFSASPHESEETSHPCGSWDDAKFVRSWLVYDSDLEFHRTPGHMNWNALLGLVVAAAVSVGFWIGAGMMIAHLWK